MFQGDEHGPQGQEALVLEEKVELERQEQVLLQQWGLKQPLYSACCALAGLPSLWLDQLALLDLEGR